MKICDFSASWPGRTRPGWFITRRSPHDNTTPVDKVQQLEVEMIYWIIYSFIYFSNGGHRNWTVKNKRDRRADVSQTGGW